MSRSAFLRNGIDAMFEDIEGGRHADIVLAALIRVLLAKGILDRSDIVSIAERLTEREEHFNEGAESDSFLANDFAKAREKFLARMARDLGLEIQVIVPTFEEKLADRTVRTRIV